MPAFTSFDGSDPSLLTSALVATNSGIVIEAGSIVLQASGSNAVNVYDGSIADLGIGSGLLLTSGSTPTTSNTSTGFGSDNSATSGFANGDADIDAVVNTVFHTQSYDATTLSFNFSVSDPNATSISFDIVFGSDEFPEWADLFVDAAVVLVNGVNYALFNHDPNHPLSVISPNVAAGYFQDNNGTQLLPIEYDGVSHVLRIVAPIRGGGALNTIKIGIADTGDHILDSGLIISNMVAGTTPGSGLVATAGAGSPGNDVMSGTAQDEWFDLQAGDDLAYAGGGADIVVAGSGNDTLYGGSGDDALKGDGGDDLLDGGVDSDTAVYAGASSSYHLVFDALSGSWSLDASASGEGIDSLRNIEQIQFSDGLFFLGADGLTAAAPPPPPLADAPGLAFIGGIGKVGQALTASVSDPDGVDPAQMSVQWQRSSDLGLTWSDISQATSTAYTVQSLDQGSSLRVAAHYTDLAGHTSTVISAERAILSSVSGNQQITLMHLAAPQGSLLATPLTTLVQRAIDLGLSANEAGQLIKGALGLAPSLSLGSVDAPALLLADPADPDLRRLEAVAVQVAITASLSDDDSGIALTLAILNARAADPHAVLDLADEATLAAILGINQADPKSSPNFSEILRRNGNIATDLLKDRDVLGSVEQAWKGVLGAEDPDAAAGLAALSQQLNLAPIGWASGALTPIVQGGSSLIQASDLLAGFSDPNAGDTLVVSALSADSGTLTANLGADGLWNGSWTFTPASGFAGPVEFSYQVSDGHGGSVSAQQLLVVTAAPTPPAASDHAASGSLQVTGEALEGGLLSASLQDLVDPDGAIQSTSFQWQREQAGSWVDIAGASGSTFQIASDQSDVGRQVRVVATSLDAQGGSTSFSSDAFTIANVNDLPSGGLTISGSAQQGQTLTVSSSIDDADGIPASGSAALSFQWQRVDLSSGAVTAVGSGTSYLATAADLGQGLRVVASYIDGGGTAEQVLSAATAAVTPPPGLTLNGTAGADVLNGGALDDKLYGLAGNDVLNGGAGRDRLDGGSGADQLNGGDGDDSYVVDNSKDLVSETNANKLTGGVDLVESSISWVLGSNVENLTLIGTGTTNATGNGLANAINGNGANNQLSGDAGDDSLSGGGGGDTLIGGQGADGLTGGTGADVFRFSLLDSRLGAIDRITDFVIGSDSIDLTDSYTIASAQLQKLGAVSAFSQAGIEALLTTTSFDRKGAASFTWLDPGAGVHTFLAINDGKAGFQAGNDALIEITGYSGDLGQLAVV